MWGLSQYADTADALGGGGGDLSQNDYMLKLWREGVGEQYKKESNTLPDSAAINLLQKVILQNTKGQYMREPNTLAVNATINLRLRYILLDTGE